MWKKDDFKKVSERDYPINGALLDKDDALFGDLQTAVESCKPIKQNPNAQIKGNENQKKKEETSEPKAGPKVSGRLILQLPHTLQVVHLKHSTGNHVLVCNTHLYWHPRGANVRIIQVNVCLRLIQREKVGCFCPVSY